MKIYIYQHPCEAGISVTFVTERGNRRFYAKPINLEFTEVEEGAAFEPTLKIPGEECRSFLASMAEALREKGIKPEESKLEGKVEALQNHLKDMRRLVFKEGK